MLNFQAIQLSHLHADGSSHPMTAAEPNVAGLDPEREWVPGARIYECRECQEQITVSPPGPADLAADGPLPRA